MKNYFFLLVLFFLLISPVYEVTAQTTADNTLPNVFDTKEFPLWAKDLRRFDIIAFGVFPFSLLVVNLFNDMFFWNGGTGMDFQKTMFAAAGLSLAIALTDHLIVRSKRNKERRRLENISSGEINIDRRTNGYDSDDEDDPYFSDDINESEIIGEPVPE